MTGDQDRAEIDETCMIDVPGFQLRKTMLCLFMCMALSVSDPYYVNMRQFIINFINKKYKNTAETQLDIERALYIFKGTSISNYLD